MTSNPVELATQIGLTRAFVDADFELITLTPREKIRTTTGGTTWAEGTSRAPQPFHIIERVTNAQTNNRVGGGEVHEEEFTILGYFDAVIGEHDIFVLRGAEWEVAKVQWFNGYEQRATVIKYGR